MATLRKLLISAKPVNNSGCPDDLCADPDCPFDDCSSSSFFPPPPPPANQSFQLSPPVIVAIALISALVVIFSYFVTVAVLRSGCSILRRRTPPVRRNASAENRQTDDDDQVLVDHPIWLINTIGLQPPVISSITAVKFRRGDGLIDGTDCSVCLSEFRENDTLRLLPKCSHAFHIGCIDTWLRSHTNCPICRASIIAVSSNEAALANDNGDLDEESVGSGSGAANDTEGSIVDQRDQSKAHTSSVDGSDSLRRCASMGRRNLHSDSVQVDGIEDRDPSNATSRVSMRRSRSSGTRLSRRTG